MGIKARYVSGYAVSTSKFKKDSDGNYTAEVLDNQAHAWTEIYIDSVGWVPVEMTPGNKTGIDRLEIQQESDSITIRMNDGRTADLITLERSDYQDSSKDDSQSDLSGQRNAKYGKSEYKKSKHRKSGYRKPGYGKSGHGKPEYRKFHAGGNKAGKQNQKGSRLNVILIAAVITFCFLQQVSGII